MDRKPVSIGTLFKKKADGQKISMITAYDYPSAVLCERAGVDIVFVGDSLGMVMMGYQSTVPVTMDDMMLHIKSVRRGVKAAYLMGDMPYMSYSISKEQALTNAARIMQEGGCDMVKLEGGAEVAPVVKAITDAGIPVCGHIGLTPQSVAMLGGYKVQGKSLAGAQKMIDDAKALEAAGAACLVMECVPSPLAKLITEATGLITIGIGAGPHCDAQVLVLHDILGLSLRSTPKMAKLYADVASQIQGAVAQYVEDVTQQKFPAPENEFAMDEDILKQLKV